jgi:hypothetical protein
MTKAFFERAEIFGKKGFDGFVAEVTVGAAGEFDGVFRANVEGFFEAAGDLGGGEAALRAYAEAFFEIDRAGRAPLRRIRTRRGWPMARCACA